MASKKENIGSAGEAKETKSYRSGEEGIENPVREGHYDADGFYSDDGHLREYDQSPVREPTVYYDEEYAGQLTREGYRYDTSTDSLMIENGPNITTYNDQPIFHPESEGNSGDCAISGGKRVKKRKRKKSKRKSRKSRRKRGKTKRRKSRRRRRRSRRR
jgi:hypothetical protein